MVVVTWQGAHLLPDCLGSLREQTLAHDVLVVDNASTDGTEELLAGNFPEVRVLRLPENTGFAGGVAAALRATDAPLLALLNDDARAEPGWLAALVDHLEAHPEAAAVTSRMLLADVRPATVNNAGVVLLPTGYGADRGAGDPPSAWAEAGEVFGFSGGAALLRREPVLCTGGFPARFFLYYEDTDASWRLRLAGWTVRYEPGAVVHHRHAASSDATSRSFAFHNERNRLLMLVRCAPVGRAAAWWGRFLLTTASLAARRARGGAIPPAHQFRLSVRLHVLASALRHLPWALRTRARRSAGART